MFHSDFFPSHFFSSGFLYCAALCEPGLEYYCSYAYTHTQPTSLSLSLRYLKHYTVFFITLLNLLLLQGDKFSCALHCSRCDTLDSLNHSILNQFQLISLWHQQHIYAGKRERKCVASLTHTHSVYWDSSCFHWGSRYKLEKINILASFFLRLQVYYVGLCNSFSIKWLFRFAFNYD